MRLLPTVWILFGFALAACSNHSQQQQPSQQKTSQQQPSQRQPNITLEGSEWQLVGIRGKAVVQSQRVTPNIQFMQENQRVAGHSGCNRFFGGYETGSATATVTPLSLSALGSTKMACLDAEANNLEHEFLSLLQQVDAYALQGDQLIFYKGAETLLRFARP
jgi:heat shock protein HslJ